MPLWTSLRMLARRQHGLSIDPYMRFCMIWTSLSSKWKWLNFFMAVSLAKVGLCCSHDMSNVIERSTIYLEFFASKKVQPKVLLWYRDWSSASLYCPKKKVFRLIWAVAACWSPRAKWQGVSTISQWLSKFLRRFFTGGKIFWHYMDTLP